MNLNQWARGLAASAATFCGLALLALCLGTAQAQAPADTDADPDSAPGTAQTWHVDNSPGDGLAGYWKFDQVRGGATLNSALLTNTTVLSGSASLTVTVSPSLTVPDTHSLLLDGANAAAVISDAAALDVAPAAFSLAVWARRTTLNTYDALYDSGAQTGKWWVFIADGAVGKTNHFGFGKRGSYEVYSARAITDSGWHHLAVVVNGTGTNNLTFYVDGAASGVATAPNLTTPTGAKRAGALLDGGLSAFFAGNLDELRLYNRALSAAEVGRLAAGRGCATDGLTWPTAFQDLQCALDTNTVHLGDAVWVAGGAYRPGSDPFVSFHQRVTGVGLFGNFNGGETSLAQRPAFNADAPLTILSGDAAGNDNPSSSATLQDNSCNVVTVGSLALPGGLTAALDGVAIQDGRADAAAGCNTGLILPNGGGLANVTPNHLSVSHALFRLNAASQQGGGLFHAGGPLTLSDVRFVSNTALVGGGLALGGGQVTITAASFLSNTASQGGALGIHPADDFAHLPITVTVSNTSFTANVAQDGGAVEDQVGDRLLDLSFDQTAFTNNRSTIGDGGALNNTAFDTGAVRTHITHSSFFGNVAGEDGGAIQSFGEQLTIADSQFTLNGSPLSVGGALAAQSVVTITHSTFTSNTALAGGGALAVFGTLTLVDSSLSGNRAFDTNATATPRQMGAGALVSGTAMITNTQFTGNQAFLANFTFENLAGGGGLAVLGRLALSGGDFRNNSADQGGGLQVLGSASITISLFELNFARAGGAVYVDGDLALLSSRLLDNHAVGSITSFLPALGGGLFLTHGGPNGLVSNNLFLGNLASCNSLGCGVHGSALSIDGAQTLVSNNTIVSRGSIVGAPGAAASVTGTTGLYNNLITSGTVGIESLGGATSEDYNLFHANAQNTTGSLSPGGHSHTADPRFVAPALDDFHLRLDSPAVDAGDNSRRPSLVTTDLDGGLRLVNVPSAPDTGAGSPPLIDIGAFEVNDQLFLPLILR